MKSKARSQIARAGTQSIERFVDVLRFLATANDSGVRVKDVVDYLGVTPGTAHRLLTALARTRLAEQSAISHRYELGPLVYELGLAAKPRVGIASTCAPSVLRLAQKTGDVAMLTARSGVDSICMDRQEGASPIRTLTGQVGIRRPLGVGAGSLAILSALPPAMTDQIIEANRLRYRQFNSLNAEMLAKLVQVTRKAGFAHTKGEMYADVGGIGLVIRDASKAPIGALNVATTVGRLPDDRVRQIVGLMRKEVSAIEQVLARPR